MQSFGESCSGIYQARICRFVMIKMRANTTVMAKRLSMNLDIALIRISITTIDQLIRNVTIASQLFLTAKSTMSQTQSSYDFDAHNTYFQQESQQIPPLANSEVSIVEPPISILQSTFSQLDKEGKGTITKSILKKATMITSDRYDKKIIREEIQKCGKQINYSRFVEIFQMANVGDRGVNQWLYSLYDWNGKGFIDNEDLRRVSNITGIQLSEQQIEQMLSTQRNNGSKEVDYEDFKYIMQEQIQYL